MINAFLNWQQRILLLFLVFFSGYCVAQPVHSGRIEGRVIDETGEAIDGVSLHLSNTASPRVTDSQGSFSWTDLQSGAYSLTASHVGYVPYSLEINLGVGQHLDILITLILSATTLDGVTVTGKTKTQQVR